MHETPHPRRAGVKLFPMDGDRDRVFLLSPKICYAGIQEKPYPGIFFYGGVIMSQLKLRHPDLQADSLHFDTLEVHAGEPRDAYGALIPADLPDLDVLF